MKFHILQTRSLGHCNACGQIVVAVVKNTVTNQRVKFCPICGAILDDVPDDAQRRSFSAAIELLRPA